MVLESLPVASVVARVKALDNDIGPNAEMEYRIMEDGPGVFNITTDEDTQEGVIILQKVHMLYPYRLWPQASFVTGSNLIFCLFSPSPIIDECHRVESHADNKHRQ